MADHYQIFGASLGITNVKKWPKQGGVWRFFHVFYTDDMKCDASVNEKTGCFGTDLSHLTYQNLEYEGCMLDTWSNVMSRNSFHHRWNDWWEETMLHRPPYHGFKLCLFIVDPALCGILTPLTHWAPWKPLEWLHCNSHSRFMAWNVHETSN